MISGGKITNVVLVQSPSDGHSRQINSRAVPTLTQSAIAAQSAKIDMVSGATWTSQSYVTSLQAALDQFAIDVTDRVCLDAGASTGGFTDCLLQRGARRVYAVEASDIAQVAERVFAVNGVRDRVTLIPGWSRTTKRR